MLREEADWIVKHLEDLSEKEALYPLANVGSSDAKQDDFQPWVHELIQTMKSGGQLMSIDIKDSPNVDLVGDLLDPKFIDQLIGFQFKCFLCANILTNIEDRDKFIQHISRLVPIDGHLILTVSNRYPYVADPVDTLFRPTPEELAKQFPDYEVVDSAIISSDTYFKLLWKKKKIFFITLARMFVPFYKPKTWWNLVKYLPNTFKPVRATALFLRRTR